MRLLCILFLLTGCRCSVESRAVTKPEKPVEECKIVARVPKSQGKVYACWYLGTRCYVYQGVTTGGISCP